MRGHEFEEGSVGGEELEGNDVNTKLIYEILIK